MAQRPGIVRGWLCAPGRRHPKPTPSPSDNDPKPTASPSDNWLVQLGGHCIAGRRLRTGSAAGSVLSLSPADFAAGAGQPSPREQTALAAFAGLSSSARMTIVCLTATLLMTASAPAGSVLDRSTADGAIGTGQPAPGEQTALAARPHIIFVMADDMGWGQTGYRGHPTLKTPHLDAMAAAGLRFERFYAGGPVCSPTRASVMTGRSPDRAGVLQHGYALRLQEKTIAQALKSAGYATGHFGKWHLNGLRGPGAPILPGDQYHPGRFGFDEWVSVTNFFDVDPLMSRQGEITQFQGDSSEIAVNEALEFFERNLGNGAPLFAVIWYGTPHSPFKALEADRAAFADLDEASANHYGELVALDRSLGTLRRRLREMKIADETLLVFCSDNGGLPKITPETVGGLRGHKGSVFEGGLRVPGIIEWPAVIRPRVTDYPACTMDLFPTVADVVGLADDVFVKPLDGISLKPLFTEDLPERPEPLMFRYGTKAALIGNRYKLLTTALPDGRYELYDLADDPQEAHDLSGQQPERVAELTRQLLDWSRLVDRSFAGQDYPEKTVTPADPVPAAWYETDAYRPYFEDWKGRWEFQRYFERAAAPKRR